jgi:hypothetical protein
MGETGNAKFFVSGAVQSAKTGATGTTESLTSTGAAGGITIDVSGFAIHGSGFFAKGMGSLFMGDAFLGDARAPSDGVDAAGEGRNSFGYIGQITYMGAASKVGFGASFGENHLKSTDADLTDEEILKRRAIIGQLTYKWSNSLRWVGEFGYIQNYGGGDEVSKSTQGSLGMMLFF